MNTHDRLIRNVMFGDRHDPETRRYAVSLTAFKSVINSNGMAVEKVEHYLEFYRAHSEAEAEGLGLRYLHEQRPGSGGWFGHWAFAKPIPEGDA